MNDRTRIAMCAGVGAVVGAFAGYLLLTERGRELRTHMEPRIDELMGEVQRLGSSFERTRRAVEEGWRSFNQLVEDRSQESWKATRH